MNRYLRLMLLSLFAFQAVRANNVQISGVTSNVTASATTITFTISWENSWRFGSAPTGNYDAVWVFIKWEGPNSGSLNHLNLTGQNNSVGSGLTLEIPSDKKGVFIYRSADGVGNIASTSVTIGVQPVSGYTGTSTDISVYAMEMVFVPEGPFYAGGSGGYIAGGTGSSNSTFLISSATPPTLGNTAGSLYDYRVPAGGSLNASFPNGYNGFYIMKYELSQAGYRDFLNSFLPNFYQFVERTDLSGSDFTIINKPIFTVTSPIRLNLSTTTVYWNPVGADANRNAVFNESNDGEWVACNYLYWSDVAAFLDWAALRPMTELEFEKACRGNGEQQYISFSSGYYVDAPLNSAPVVNTNTANESVTNTGGSRHYFNSSGLGIGGPLRNGYSATSNTNRINSGASVWGVYELSGNVWEPCVTTANAAGRSFTGQLGDGELDGNGRANTPGWPGVFSNLTTDAQTVGTIAKGNTAGICSRGGSFSNDYVSAIFNNFGNIGWPTARNNASDYGCRGVRQRL